MCVCVLIFFGRAGRLTHCAPLRWAESWGLATRRPRSCSPRPRSAAVASRRRGPRPRRAFKTRGPHANSPPPPPLPLTFFFPQQNEIFRENLYTTWSFNRANVFPLLLMVVVLPLGMHHLVKDEFAVRDQLRGKPVQERF